MTTAEVAEHLAVDESTVRRWITDGRLPAARPGQGYRIDPRDLDELLTISRPLAQRPRAAHNAGHRHSVGISA